MKHVRQTGGETRQGRGSLDSGRLPSGSLLVLKESIYDQSKGFAPISVGTVPCKPSRTQMFTGFLLQLLLSKQKAMYLILVLGEL